MRYQREGDGTSFERVAFFTDAVFAIALTLVVVSVGVPAVTDDGSASELWRALRDQRSEFVSFAVGVLVIGYYWFSHHAGFDELASVDTGYVLWTIPYVALVAFLPYPIRLVGTYDANAVSWVCFAVNLAAVSTMETVLFVHSWKASLLTRPLGDAEGRWRIAMAFIPVPVFLLSAPLAFIHPVLTFVAWGFCPVAQGIERRRRPAQAADVSG